MTNVSRDGGSKNINMHTRDTSDKMHPYIVFNPVN